MTDVTITVHAMAMPFQIALTGIVSKDTAREAIEGFHADLTWADDVFSLWKPESPLSRLGRGEVAVADCPDEVAAVLDLCEGFRAVTDGAFDARRPDGVVDPTGIVKMWAVARATWRLDAAAAQWMVGASGDVVVSGGEHHIGIADPRAHGDLTGAEVVDAVVLGPRFRALASSGGAQVADHIWDPVTGDVARHYMQASVVGEDPVACDAWATAICAGGPTTAALAAERGFEVLVITGGRYDGSFDAQASEGWPTLRR